jgi:hypothetical protein
MADALCGFSIPCAWGKFEKGLLILDSFAIRDQAINKLMRLPSPSSKIRYSVES